MAAIELSVREISFADIDPLVSYWTHASRDFLLGMGADPDKIPDGATWRTRLEQQIAQDYPDKQAYATIWLINGQASGHCNVNNIIYGEEAYMHLHVWKPENRQKGAGVALVKGSLPFFFRHLRLKKLYCEPYSLNPGPNKTLERAGFHFIRSYKTIPGPINLEQIVNRWEISREEIAGLGSEGP